MRPAVMLRLPPLVLLGIVCYGPIACNGDALADVAGNTLVLTRGVDDGSISSAVVAALRAAESDEDGDGGGGGREQTDLSNRVCDYDGGTLTLSHPHDLRPTDRHFSVCQLFLRAYEMTVDRVNAYPRCGVSVGGRRYGLRLRSYGEDSNLDKALAISRLAAPTTDFFLGPYTSPFTDRVSRVANDTNKVMVAPGSYFLYVYEDRPASFGVLPLPPNYLKQVVPMLAEAGARSVHAVYEKGPGAACMALPDLAAENGMDVRGMSEVPRGPTLEDFRPLARNMSLPENDPDVVITCTSYGCASWMRALREADWSPRAQVFNVCFGSDDFVDAAGTDVEYTLGMSPWDRSLAVSDGAAGWTASEFSPLFETYSGRTTTYHAALGVASVSVLVQAIERADSLETHDVAEKLRTETFPTLFGNIRFNGNGQNDMQLLATQYDGEGILNVVYPEASRTAPLVYPMPTFGNRDCVKISPCGAAGRADGDDGTDSAAAAAVGQPNTKYSGTCLPDGTCRCDSEGQTSVGAGPGAACYVIPREDMNYISASLKATGIAFFSIQALASAAFVPWAIYYRKRRVVKASQPFFLVLVALGCAVLSSSILPMSIESGYRYVQDPVSGKLTSVPNESVGRADVACMAFPWLFVIGFVVTFSSLFAKVWRIKKVVDAAESMRRKKVEPKDVIIIMVILLLVAIAILIAWQFVAPLQWEREVLRADELGYPAESIGRCASDGALPFLVALAVFIACCLLYSLCLCYQTRAIPSEFNEGKWITASIVSILQILLLAIPVLVIVYDVTSDAFFFVRACIVFLTSMSVTSFIFIPKILAVHVSNQSDGKKKANFSRWTQFSGNKLSSNLDNKPESRSHLPNSSFYNETEDISNLRRSSRISGSFSHHRNASNASSCSETENFSNRRLSGRNNSAGENESCDDFQASKSRVISFIDEPVIVGEGCYPREVADASTPSLPCNSKVEEEEKSEVNVEAQAPEPLQDGTKEEGGNLKEDDMCEKEKLSDNSSQDTSD